MIQVYVYISLKISISDDRPLTFVDLWGAPSSYGQYVYWTRSNCSIKVSLDH